MRKVKDPEIGQRIREHRDSLGYTREQVSKIVDISPQFLSEVERGVKGVSSDMLRKLCDGLGLTADYVLWGKKSLADVSPIIAMLATIDQTYLPRAEDLLKVFHMTVAMKSDLGKTRPDVDSCDSE